MNMQQNNIIILKGFSESRLLDLTARRRQTVTGSGA